MTREHLKGECQYSEHDQQREVISRAYGGGRRALKQSKINAENPLADTPNDGDDAHESLFGRVADPLLLVVPQAHCGESKAARNRLME
jgi:hypothetical protein